MKTSSLQYAWVFLLAGLLLSCQSNEPKHVSLTIIQTSDVHGAVFAYDFTLDKASLGSLSQVYSLVAQYKADGKENLILLDNGDLIQGDPTSYYYNYIRTDTLHLFPRVLGFMGYDAATIGNHDIEGGHAVYDRVVKESPFPWLAANILSTSDSTPYFEPYTIIHRSGLKIAILGLITPQLPQWLPGFLYEGMYFEDMVESARKWVDIIERDEQPDLLIGLFHSGVDKVSDYQEYMEHASAHVARQVEGFDLILAGHDHKGWNTTVIGPTGDTVPVMATRSRAKDVAVAELDFFKQRDGKLKKNWKTNLISTDTIAPSPEFMAKFDREFEEIKSYTSDTIGHLVGRLDFSSALFGPSEAVDLIHQAQIWASQAGISLAASMSYEGSIGPGPIRVGDLFRIYRYENYLYVMELYGHEIRAFLEYATGKWFNVMKSPKDDLLQYKRDPEGNILTWGAYPATAEPFYNYSSAAGIRYTVDLRKPIGEKVNITSTATAEAFDLNKKYKVAINSYRANGGGGHITQGAGISRDSLSSRIIWCSDKEIRGLIADYIKAESENRTYSANWQVLPLEWYTPARAREVKRWNLP